MRVIGTAGHVDHGKSSLVQRLTGIDPDRLAEEKARQMTIDLGFAWLTLPGDLQIGIVDVPGHRDFIENMLAGVGGIDLAVLVIAADEGIMPQTREHLAILDLLNVENLIVALSKVDLIDDEDWLTLVEMDISELLETTAFRDAPIMRVSAHSGQGIDDLITALGQIIGSLPPHSDIRQPRLPIDRVFSVEGFGTVVTGTLSGGTLAAGDSIEIQPAGHHARIRGLQSYKKSVEVALPGSRVAVNLSGISKHDITRGDVLARPGQLSPTNRIDCIFRHLPDAPRLLKHNTQVKFFAGASESLARLRLLDQEVLPPGETGWIQLLLDAPIALTRGDRYILRVPSPAETIGGGHVVNPQPARRWRRFQTEVIADLEMRLSGTPADRVVQAADADTPRNLEALRQQTHFADDTLQAAVAEAQSEGRLATLNGAFWAMRRLQATCDQLRAVLVDYHARYPLRRGMPREALRSQLKLPAAVFNALLEQNDDTVTDAGQVRLADHEVQFTPQQHQAIERLWQMIQAQPYTPPSFQEASQITGDDVLHALIERGDLVQVQSNIIFDQQTYATLVDAALTIIDNEGSIEAKSLRNQFETTRKYAIGLLEHLDAVGITRRVGDSRVRGPKAPARSG